MTVPTPELSRQPAPVPVPHDEDAPSLRWPWLTPRRLTVFVLAWLGLFSLGSLFVSNPFESEDSAAADPNFWHVMYLHGLLIGLVGLAALLTCQVFELRSRHVRLWIAGGVVIATLTTTIGGIFDKKVPGAELAMWTQIIGFFALDEILLLLLVGLWRERPRRSGAAALPFWAAWAAALSMFVAAIMGHLAGWILEFGDHPGIIASYIRFIGVKPDDFTANLIGSHSHEMAVGSMALITVLAVRQFGLSALTGRIRTLTLAALGWLGFGALLMTVAYVAMAFTSWAPPTLFQSAGGANGIAGDDIVTGLTVMLGGLVALATTAYGRRRDVSLRVGQPLALAAAIVFTISFATVVVAGYAIEMHETYFGAGDPSAHGAVKDAVYTWLHQDIGLFLMPALVLVAVATHRMVAAAHQALVAWLVLAGAVVTFGGGMVFVFADPARHGGGFALCTVGLLVVAAGVALAGYRMATDRRAAKTAASPPKTALQGV